MKEALLETAIEHFGERGFEGAATREIARASGTAMSSITYHFGGKEGLYLAAAEHIAGNIGSFLAPALSQAREKGARSRGEAVEALLVLLDRFAMMMLSERSHKWARFIIREQQQPTEAFNRIYDNAMRPVVETFSHLVALARPDLGEREVRATGFLLWGEAVALRAGRASLCRLLELETIAQEDEAFLRQRLQANARAILTATTECAT